jgi:isoprenylcysteine carboxyl methyltransferase (ICMT) family protein YpbQ
MIGLIGPTLSILFAIFSILLSKSKKNHQRLVENGGEIFAANITKCLRVGGFLYLAFSIMWFLVTIYTRESG